MKELFNMKSALFTESQNSIPSSRYEYDRVWRKSDFSNINLHYKNIAKNGPNKEFLEPKMVLDFIFDGLSCISIVCIMQNHKKPGS